MLCAMNLCLFEVIFVTHVLLHCVETCNTQPKCKCCDRTKAHVILHQVNVSDQKKGKELEMARKRITDIALNAFTGFQNLNRILLMENEISVLKPGVFKNLKSLQTLDLSNNCLRTLNRGSFFGLTSLKDLDMRKNRIHRLPNSTFEHLICLEELDLKRNSLEQLNANSFTGLKLLESLGLSDNRIHKLENGTFQHLINLEDLWLADNDLVQISSETFTGLISLKELILSKNRGLKPFNNTFKHLTSLKVLALDNCGLNEVNTKLFHGLSLLGGLYLNDNKLHKLHKETFRPLKQLKLLDLSNTTLTYVNKVMFVGLTTLTYLELSGNGMKDIDPGSFRDLTNLKELYLQENNLTKIRKEYFTGLTQLQVLWLNHNEIHYIEPHAFSGIFSNQTKLQIEMQDNKIYSLQWNLFISSSNVSKKDISLDRFRNVNLLIDEFTFKCERHICWIKHLKWKNVFTDYDYGSCSRCGDNYYSVLEEKCDKQIETICPNKEKWCMFYENNTCETLCKDAGRTGGKLVLDGDFCPFQYFCKCSCPLCVEECASQGKLHIPRSKDIFDCGICNCKCDRNPNCWKTCNGPNFLLRNGTVGCLECRCSCPAFDCDAKCSGQGRAIVRKDESGCQVCEGCKYQKSDETGSVLKGVAVVLPLSLVVLCLIICFVICICVRYSKQKEERFSDKGKNLSTLDILTQNLDPELAQQVKESWIDEKKMWVRDLLGHGQFGLIWSGELEKEFGRKYPVAIKVVKAEYKDVWTVETKWNEKHELRPQFKKRPVQVTLDNQIIFEFLKEAIVMNNFKHPNILNMFGISVYKEKPCIILPLMCHGDLKKYLIGNKLNLISNQLMAFSLGVAKGMAHLAEKKCVHCDLAARNCLLDANLVVKISDFGLAKNVEGNYNYIQGDRDKPMPVRWMSIEAFRLRKFTLKSDVWSYGVVLWEIFSYGSFPYMNIDNTDILKYLIEGSRMEKPASCADKIYEIMLKCWSKDPDERPDFSTILEMFNKIADKEADYTEVTDEYKLIYREEDKTDMLGDENEAKQRVGSNFSEYDNVVDLST